MERLNGEETCTEGTAECPGEYNRGACEALGAGTGGGEGGWAGHRGLTDEPLLPAAGDFFLVGRAALHRMGGYLQVASTTHLDALLACKARGAGLRQVVLLRPCLMAHQRHPAPMQPLRFILPGWELSPEKCAAVAGEVRALAGASLDEGWGFPEWGELSETRVGAAGPGDWQWWVLEHEDEQGMASAGGPLTRSAEDVARAVGGVGGRGWRNAVLLVAARLRRHALRLSAQSRWCAVEPYSRWPSDHPTMPFAAWWELLRSASCRDLGPLASPGGPGPRPPPRRRRRCRPTRRSSRTLPAQPTGCRTPRTGAGRGRGRGRRGRRRWR